MFIIIIIININEVSKDGFKSNIKKTGLAAIFPGIKRKRALHTFEMTTLKNLQ